MLYLKQQIKGFSLINLAVIITLIIIFTSFITFYISNIVLQSRNIVRLNDVETLRESLALYYAQSGIFPDELQIVAGSSLITPAGTLVLDAVPEAPGVVEGVCTVDSYDYQLLEGGNSYQIHYCFSQDTNNMTAGDCLATSAHLCCRETCW